jgi:hypothetical protein
MCTKLIEGQEKGDGKMAVNHQCLTTVSNQVAVALPSRLIVRDSLS